MTGVKQKNPTRVSFWTMLFPFGVTSPFLPSSQYTMSVSKVKVAFWKENSNMNIKYLGNPGVKLSKC